MTRSLTFPVSLAALALALAAPGKLPAQLRPSFVRGDINLDGRVTMGDACYFMDFRFFGGPAPRCMDAADTDDNGSVDTAGLSEPLFLLSWLFKAPSPPTLPPPFPAAGVDPTNDGLPCSDPSLVSPEIGRGYLMSWRAPDVVRVGKPTELFVLGTTGSAIEGLSFAYRFDKSLLGNVRVDLEGTIFPEPLRAAFEASPFFRFATGPSADPRFGLVIAGAYYVLDSSGPMAPGEGGGGAIQRVPFPATTGPIHGAPLFHVTADVLPTAPLGEVLLFEAAKPEDFVETGKVFHGVQPEFVVLDGIWSHDLGFAAVPHPSIITDGEEIFRGDSDGSAQVELTDAIHTLGFLFLGSEVPPCMDAADANDDGAVDLSDATYTLGYLFLGSAAPPSPGPTKCGFDFTPDGLPSCLLETCN